MMARRSGVVAAVVLVALFVGAGILNAGAWLMGSQASTLNLVGTLVALIAWPVHGVWVGSTQRDPARAWRFPVVFWSVVVALAVGGWLVLIAAPESTVSEGLSVVGGAALFLGTAPFHGLTRLVDVGGSLATVVGVSLAVLAVSLLAASLARRMAARPSTSHSPG